MDKRVKITIKSSGKKKQSSKSTSTSTTAESTSVQIPTEIAIKLEQLSNVAGIGPYINKPELIPDLLYMMDTLKPEDFAETIRLANPQDPKSILFVGPLQVQNEETYQIEMSNKTAQLEAVEDPTVKCAKCGQHKVTRFAKQTRRGDEGQTYFFTCTNRYCGNKWHTSV